MACYDSLENRSTYLVHKTGRIGGKLVDLLIRITELVHRFDEMVVEELEELSVGRCGTFLEILLRAGGRRK